MSGDFRAELTPGYGARAAVGAGVATALFLVLALCLTGRAGSIGLAALQDSRADLFIGLMATAAACEAALSARTLNRESACDTPSGPLLRRLDLATGLLLLWISIAPLIGRSPEPSKLSLGLLGGALLMTTGLGLRLMAIARLGARFTSIDAVIPSAALERGGVYRHLAHPSELGLLLLTGGGLILIGRPIDLTAAILIYLLALVRTGMEERGLCARHGGAYRTYRARTFDPMPGLIFDRGKRI